MDGEHDVTVESLALAWLASMGTPASSCHVPGWKQVAVPGAAPAAKGEDASVLWMECVLSSTIETVYLLGHSL